MQIIAGTHKGKKLFCPTDDTIRPTSGRIRGSIFNICQLTIENTTFLDLFAGAGAIGLEALSRGSTHATFVDQSKLAFAHIQKNVAKLQEESRSKILNMDVFKALDWFKENSIQFDIIFADPPYGKDQRFLSNEVLKFVDAFSLLKPDGELFLEDDVGAGKEMIPLSTLQLKSSRSVGRTLLRHYIRLSV